MTNRRIAHWAFGLSCTLAAFVCAESTSQACIGWLFGHPCGCYGGGYSSYYAPSYTYGYSAYRPYYSAYRPYYPPVTSYYPPTYGYAPTYAPGPSSGCCDPCGISSGCPSGNCGINVQRPSDNWRATEPDYTSPGRDDTGAPRTFEEEPPRDPMPPANPDDAGLGREPDPFGGPGGEDNPADLPDLSSQRRTFKPEATESSSEPAEAEPKAPAPTRDILDEPSNGPNAAGESNEPAALPRLNIPPLELDGKLTGHTPPQYGRLNLRSTFRNPSIVRRDVVPELGQEVPTRKPAHLAKK